MCVLQYAHIKVHKQHRQHAALLATIANACLHMSAPRAMIVTRWAPCRHPSCIRAPLDVRAAVISWHAQIAHLTELLPDGSAKPE